MGRHGNGAWTVFVTERKLLLVLRKKYNELLDFEYSILSFSMNAGPSNLGSLA